MPAESEIPDTDVMNGVSLEQFAGVSAALAEGLPQDDVFEQEGIDAAAWPAAERAWREAIADSTELNLRYMQKRRQADDCLGRKIDPLDNDPEAWIGLLGALAMVDDADTVLVPLGVTMVDVGRLGRAWKRKVEADPEVGKQLAELAPDAKPPGRVTTEAIRLRPFPWTRGVVRSADATEVPEEADVEPSEEAMGEGQARRVRASFQIAEEAPAPGPAAPSPTAADSEPTAMLSATAFLPPTSILPANAMPVVRLAPDADPDQTLPPVSIASRTLPFRKGVAAAPPLARPVADDQSGETMGVSSLVDTGETLPFDHVAAVNLMLLDSYADMAAQLRAAPERADSIMARVGLDDPEQRRSIHDLWKLRFQANPELKARFDVVVEEKLHKLKAGNRQ